jgi:uncharacterized Zn finger protein
MDILAVGTEVTIKVQNVMWRVRDRYAAGVIGPEFNIYTGTIVREKWFGADEIGITTGNPDFAFRRIKRNRIVAVNEKTVDYTPIKSDRIEITVQGSKGNTYVVTKENGKVSCSCPGYSYRKSCRHITEAA